MDKDIATLHEARRSMAASLIAVKGHLDEPYPDDPRWTPWTRFIERELQRLDETKSVIARVEAELSRLRDDYLTYLHEATDAKERAEAAEARLRQLEAVIEPAREYMDCFDLRGVEVAISDEAFAALRAALRDLEEKA